MITSEIVDVVFFITLGFIIASGTLMLVWSTIWCIHMVYTKMKG